MNATDATISTSEIMSEDARIKQQLFITKPPSNPFTAIDPSQVFSDLTEARQQIAEGKGLDMNQSLKKMGKKHGFI